MQMGGMMAVYVSDDRIYALSVDILSYNVNVLGVSLGRTKSTQICQSE